MKYLLTSLVVLLLVVSIYAGGLRKENARLISENATVAANAKECSDSVNELKKESDARAADAKQAVVEAKKKVVVHTNLAKKILATPKPAAQTNNCEAVNDLLNFYLKEVQK